MKRKLAFSVLVFVVFLLLLESAARLLEANLSFVAERPGDKLGWQAEFFASLFDWHEPDPDLLWRFKANLDNPLIKTNSAHLIGDEVTAEKYPHTFRILLLGDSAPVGIGLKSRKLAFGEMLKRFLQIECESSRQVEVINAAVSGYSSEQIVRFLELKGWSYEPDLVILYCGNNDASISGPYSDRELLKGQRLKAVRNFLSRLAVYRVLRGVLAKRISEIGSPGGSLKIRVAPDRFGENLHRIVGECAKHHCPLVILKPPVPMLWPAGLQFKVFTHVTGRDDRLILPDAIVDVLGREIKYCLSEEMFVQLYGQGDKFTRIVYLSAYADSLSPAQAIKRYNQLLKTDSDNPALLNNLGVSLWENGQYREAGYYLQKAREMFVDRQTDSTNPSLVAAGSPFLFNIGMNYLYANGARLSPLEDTNSAALIYLDSALQTDYFSLRIKKDYWEKIDELKAQPNVTVVDLPTVFRENGGEKLFIDHCHPTAEGHLLIARELFKVICGRFGPMP
ncbi:MAG: SGNH/GDSL hydrolase family protein [Chloroflexi bacterium]|nr:SGNH/GDSL hydrolase family protein [Chloroflexota bacterium]